MVISAGAVSEIGLTAKGLEAMKTGSKVEIQLTIPSSNKIYILSGSEVSEVLNCITDRREISLLKSEAVPGGYGKLPTLQIRFNGGTAADEVITLISTSKGYLMKDGEKSDLMLINKLDPVFNRILSIHS